MDIILKSHLNQMNNSHFTELKKTLFNNTTKFYFFIFKKKI